LLVRYFIAAVVVVFFFSFSKVTNCLPSSVTWEHPQCLVIMCVISKKRAGMLIIMCYLFTPSHFVDVIIKLIAENIERALVLCLSTTNNDVQL